MKLLALVLLISASTFQPESATVERVSDGAFEFRCQHGLHRAKTDEPVKVGQTITVRWRRVVEHDGKLEILTHAAGEMP